MGDRPQRVEREELDFDPKRSYVYWCSDCESFLDVDEAGGHWPGEGDHGGAVKLSRVVLGEELG